jgi:hypothetical protein
MQIARMRGESFDSIAKRFNTSDQCYKKITWDLVTNITWLHNTLRDTENTTLPK